MMVEKSWYNNGIVVVMWWNNNSFQKRVKKQLQKDMMDYCENDHGTTMACNPGIYDETCVARQQIC
jgi:hypothetical protein